MKSELDMFEAISKLLFTDLTSSSFFGKTLQFLAQEDRNPGFRELDPGPKKTP